ncbi:MAG TPA: glycosyltransferase family 2 protein [Terriglobales bacterium]|nr:glycosyltransferase family 2 protein [Terriglobales bacterium]
MHRVLQLSNHILFVYYLLSNLIYLVLLITAIFKNTLHRHRLASLRLERLKNSPFTPPVTLLVPAHNEEKFIVDSVRSLLTLDYPELEVIVVNDGSGDKTVDELQRAFELHPARLLYIPDVPCAAVRAIYSSWTEPRLLVLDKKSVGSKADAINAGLNAATSPYICVVDADSILERDSLLRIMAGIFSDPSRVVAVGGIVRVLNGCRVVHGRLEEVRLPKRGLEVLQVIEYLRAFLIGREAWAHYNALPIISGAFGIFRKDLVKRIGGFRADAVGEDLDLVVRLHRYLQEKGQDYHISFIPDPTCWTEVPADLKSLARQRARWHKGLLDALWPNRDMLFRSRYGRVGSLILPYMWLFEWFAPVMEFIGYSSIIVAAILGLLSRQFLLLFFIFGYAFATLISIGSVLLEEMTYRRYSDWQEVARLLFYCLVEHFPYRQMTMIWRLQGIWQYMRGDLKWGELKRLGAGAGA